MLNNVELQYKGLRILSRYCSCQDSEFRSAMETSSVDIDKLLSKNFFLWIQCPKISLLLFKDGADLRMESFSCKQSPHTLLFGANGFTLLTTKCCENVPFINRQTLPQGQKVKQNLQQKHNKSQLQLSTQC